VPSGLEGSASAARAALLKVSGGEDPHPGARGSRTKRLVKRVLPPSARTSLNVRLTDALRLRSRARASRLSGQRPLKLHLGSAHSPKPGWVNVDLIAYPSDLPWNLRRPLPFMDGAVDAVFHEHVLEHFPLDQSLFLIEEAHRLLRAGGVLRIGVPDAGACLRAYVNAEDSLLETLRPGYATRMLAVQDIFYCCGHKTMFDLETLQLCMHAAGFQEIARRPFGDSQIAPCPDSEHRRAGTLYVEATR
jgi:SAM-dependent methyltransferase